MAARDLGMVLPEEVEGQFAVRMDVTNGDKVRLGLGLIGLRELNETFRRS